MTLLDNFVFDFSDEDTSYLTHSLHPYPAKFPPQLPRQVLTRFSQKDDKILDPFCGSGTTLVEARLQGIDSVGVDVNALACLLSKVKATPLSEAQSHFVNDFIAQLTAESYLWQFGQRKAIKVHPVEGLEHWFQKNVAEELTFIREKIWEVSDEDIQDFLKIVFSSIIVRVSNQESDTRFAAIEKNVPDNFTLNLFLERVTNFHKRVQEFSYQANGSANLEIYNADSRNLQFLTAETFDLIVTSPPYANTYDYYLYHKFRKRWLDLSVRFAQYKEIGSRREFSSLKKDPQKWIEDLQQCFNEMARVLKAGKLAFIVIGDSIIRKELLKMDEIITDLVPRCGFRVVETISSDLSGHSKLFNPAFRRRGKKEHLFLLRRFDD